MCMLCLLIGVLIAKETRREGSMWESLKGFPEKVACHQRLVVSLRCSPEKKETGECVQTQGPAFVKWLTQKGNGAPWKPDILKVSKGGPAVPRTQLPLLPFIDEGTDVRSYWAGGR